MMKRIIFIVTLLLPVVAVAQEGPSVSSGDQAGMASPSQAVAPQTDAEGDTWNDSSRVTAFASSFGRAASAQSPQNGAPSSQSSAPSGEIKRPKIEGSMVGYIDNAIVGTEARLRFEVAIDDQYPDLGEFFYAKCGCYNLTYAQNLI
jgi:hypothetical protein